MKILKQLLQILTTLAFILTLNVGLANTISSEPQEQEQEGRRKTDQGMRPDGDATTQPEVYNPESEVSDVEPTPIKNPSENKSNIDSVEDDSVSKYNFIFYFLYKFKYDTEEAP